MKKVIIHWFLSLIVLGLSACQVDSAPQNPNPTPTTPSPTTPTPTTPTPTTPSTVPASAGVVVPLRRAQIEQNFSAISVDAVYAASQLQSSTTPVLTGTLTQGSNNQFTYSASPSERLRIVLSNGSTLEYTFTTLEGDFNQSNGTRFLRKDHRVTYRLVTSSGTDVDVDLNRSNGVYQNSVNGTLVDAGVSYQVDTQTQGQVLSDFGSGSVRFESEEQTTGTITGTGFSATIDETFTYTLVLVSKAAEDVRHTINNTWTIGNDTFELTNATIFRVFSDGRPIEFDSWRATGTLTRNGQSIGGLSQEQATGSVNTVLTVEGEKIVLFSDQTF